MTEGKPPLSARRYSWIGRAKDKETNGSSQDVLNTSIASTHPPAAGSPGLFSRAPPSSTSVSTLSTMDTAERPPKITHRASSSSLVRQQLDQQSQSNLERTQSHTNGDTSSSRPSGSFSKLSLSNMMGGLSTLSLTRSSNEERGRADNKRRSSSVSGRNQDDNSDPYYRARSMSPFRRRNSRVRDSSPYEALKMSQSDLDSDNESSRRSIRPRNAFSQSSDVLDDDSMDENDSDADSEDSWSDDDVKFDPITTQNTEQNSLIPVADSSEHDGIEAPDPLGEGVNIVVPPEPYFPSTLNNVGRRNARRRKSTKYDALPVDTSRPTFKRDRCTITVKQGDPALALEENRRRSRKYIVASDLSEESKYAVEWGVGTVVRDGDEMIIVSVREDENKVDPLNQSSTDRAQKIKVQQERQTLAYILVRQVTSLLQRTKLNVTVACQAWHAKNARRMLLDIIDYEEPTMVIVGSRGLGKLKGILLGSTSHYLVQKCSVPVMVARRRLKRPARKSAHLSTHRARKTLAEAARVERVTPKVDKDVEHMRDELERDEDRRDEVNFDDIDTEPELDTPFGQKVRGD